MFFIFWVTWKFYNFRVLLHCLLCSSSCSWVFLVILKFWYTWLVCLAQVVNFCLNPGWRPLDLCEAEEINPDVPALGYQSSHPGGMTLPNQGFVPSMLPTSGVNSSLPGSSSGMVLGHNLSSSPGPVAASVRCAVLWLRILAVIRFCALTSFVFIQSIDAFVQGW